MLSGSPGRAPNAIGPVPRSHAETFELDPCIPASWPGYAITQRFRRQHEISVADPGRRCRGVEVARLDGVAAGPAAIALVDDGGTHDVHVVLGGGNQRVATAVGS